MKKTSKGFTLFELLVAASVFIVLVGLAGGIFSFYVQKNRDQQATQRVQQDLQNFVEVIDREIRTGYGHTFSTHGVLTGSNILSLVNQRGKCAGYMINSGSDPAVITRFEYPQIPNVPGRDADSDRCDNPTAITSWSNEGFLTSAKTNIVRLFFDVKKSSVKDNGTADDYSDDYLSGDQGRVTVFVKACPAGTVSGETCIDYQTTVTSRQLIPAPVPAPNP